jgi:hypothetical protein
MAEKQVEYGSILPVQRVQYALGSRDCAIVFSQDFVAGTTETEEAQEGPYEHDHRQGEGHAITKEDLLA